MSEPLSLLLFEIELQFQACNFHQIPVFEIAAAVYDFAVDLKLLAAGRRNKVTFLPAVDHGGQFGGEQPARDCHLPP